MEAEICPRGIALYVVSTVFVIYTSLNQGNEELAKTTWNVLFWITLLFTAVNAIAKSFTQENRERNLYYYTLMSPQAVILSKMVYNAGLMILLTVIALAVFTVMLGSPVGQWAIFSVVVLLGGLGFLFIEHDFGHCGQGWQQCYPHGYFKFPSYTTFDIDIVKIVALCIRGRSFF